jgi:murein DD-endopeptidase MepM/ murein hydrolase activator NlpD
VGVDHGHGVVSLMMHLHAVTVREGEVVRAGDKLGEVGSTGRSTGPHLHWGLYVGGQAVDPASWMKEKEDERELSLFANLPIWAM